MGQTTRDVKQRVAEQLKTAAIKNYTIELDEVAERDDGTLFSDHEVRAALAKKGFAKVELEWMHCTVAEVKSVLVAPVSYTHLDVYKRQLMSRSPPRSSGLRAYRREA